MHVHLFATLRAATGQKVVDLPLPPQATAQMLLDALLVRYPALRPLLVDDEGALLSYVHLFVNGRDVQYLAHGPYTPLKPQDQVSVFPAVGGG